MARRGRRSNGYIDEYLSYNNSGIDAAKFYRDMGTNILQVSNETGISRQTITRFVANYTTDFVNEKIISYLEESIIADYRATIQDCKKQIDDIKEKTNSAWEMYLEREKMLDEQRMKCHIERKYPIERRVREEEILEKV